VVLRAANPQRHLHFFAKATAVGQQQLIRRIALIDGPLRDIQLLGFIALIIAGVSQRFVPLASAGARPAAGRVCDKSHRQGYAVGLRNVELQEGAGHVHSAQEYNPAWFVRTPLSDSSKHLSRRASLWARLR
jgi:hypothetical protein